MSNLSHCRFSYKDCQCFGITGGRAYKPSKTSLNWANRAPGRAPVETRDDMLLTFVNGVTIAQMAVLGSVRGSCRNRVKLEKNKEAFETQERLMP